MPIKNHRIYESVPLKVKPIEMRIGTEPRIEILRMSPKEMLIQSLDDWQSNEIMMDVRFTRHNRRSVYHVYTVVRSWIDFYSAVLSAIKGKCAPYQLGSQLGFSIQLAWCLESSDIRIVCEFENGFEYNRDKTREGVVRRDIIRARHLYEFWVLAQQLEPVATSIELLLAECRGHYALGTL
jgi:hypothetical protein